MNIFIHTPGVNSSIHRRYGVDFKTATDRLMELGVLAKDIAEALGLQPNTVRAMRLDPESGHHRTPPPNWQPELKKLAAGRGGRLAKLAEELEVGELDGAAAGQIAGPSATP